MKRWLQCRRQGDGFAYSVQTFFWFDHESKMAPVNNGRNSVWPGILTIPAVFNPALVSLSTMNDHLLLAKVTLHGDRINNYPLKTGWPLLLIQNYGPGRLGRVITDAQSISAIEHVTIQALRGCG
jgi:hypothetical protein